MGAVSVIVSDITAVVQRVDAVNVVDVTVLIVIDTVAGDFPWIRPDVGREIGMVVIDPGVNCGHNDAGITGGLVPRLRRVDLVESPEGFTAGGALRGGAAGAGGGGGEGETWAGGGS